MAFFEFKTYIRKRNIYNPEPKSFVIDANEKKAILNENKIRKEQGEPLRKE
jgi:DNA-directed RNA polymerase subunit H (RpoH/RPB5)